MDYDPAEKAVENFLEGRPSVDDVRVWRQALERRRDMLQTELDRDPDAAEYLRPKLEKMEQQIRTLREEETISSFVEDSVRAIISDVGPVGPDSAPHDTTLPPWASIDIDDEPEPL